MMFLERAMQVVVTTEILVEMAKAMLSDLNTNVADLDKPMMQEPKIVKKIKDITELYQVAGCTTAQIDEAQNALGLQFPEEFIDYVQKFGAISFYGTEWTGLNVKGYRNVIETTQNERALNPNFPEDCFVLENLGTEGLLAIADEQGHVFSFQQGHKKAWCDSLSDYLAVCLAREKY